MVLLFSLFVIFGYIFYFFAETFNTYAEQESYNIRQEFVFQYRRLYSAVFTTRTLLSKIIILPNFLTTLLLVWNTNILLYKCSNFPLITNYLFVPLSEFFFEEITRHGSVDIVEDLFSFPVDTELFLETQVELLQIKFPGSSQQYGELLSF